MTRGSESPHEETAVAAEPEPLSDVQLLGDNPSVGSLLALFGAPVETQDHLGDESISPEALRAIVAGLLERQHTEREAFLSALTAYKDLSERLAIDLADARDLLAAQGEADRREREHLVMEFLDRLDVLAAKISTSAARYSAQLEDKDRLLEDSEQRVQAYAGRAATAQAVIDDIHRSSSWRMTAPLRLMSRLLAQRRSQPEA